jgi:two-component system, NtrC family, response regulator HydG
MAPQAPDWDDRSTTLQPLAQARAAAGRTSFRLVVLEGPDQGAVFSFDASTPSPILVGTSPACQLRLRDPHVSRRHLALEVGEGRVHATDLASTNGTRVAGVGFTGAFLEPGAVVVLGATAAQLELSESSPPPMFSSERDFGRVLGASIEMRRLYPLLARLAQSDVPILIEGETGTGKELLAEALHENGLRSAGPFVVFDCTAVPPNLVESELFGHERGAFTGAVSTRMGVFEQAHGGTLLIDEIGDLEPALQPKLLRAVERRQVQRLGGTQRIDVDVRVIAATRRDLDRLVQEGRFRDDLFHRLVVARVELPPLRRRGGDLELLARTFWRELGGDPAGPPLGALHRWSEESWPGNVRQLRNAVAREIALGGMIAPRSSNAPPSSPAPSLRGTMQEILDDELPLTLARQRLVYAFERCYVERLTERFGDDTARAAKAAGIAPRYLRLLRARYRSG